MAVPAYRYSMSPGMRSGNVVYDSPGTQIFGGDAPDKHGLICWDSTGQGIVGRYAASKKTIILWGFRRQSGINGRLLDLHTTPADSPYGWYPLEYAGGSGTAVAPFSIDYWGHSYSDSGGTAEGLMAVVEPNHWEPWVWATRDQYHFTILTQAEINALVNVWTFLWIEITWGRTDGSTPSGPGGLRIGVVGESTPRVDVSPMNTHWHSEHLVATWVVSYDSTLFDSSAVVDLAAPRVGRTPAEALNDTPVFYTSWDDNSGISSLGTVGGGEAIPAWLGGATATPPPTNTVPPTITVIRGRYGDGDYGEGDYGEAQTLMTSTGTWTGNPVITFTYQWQRCNSSGTSCVDIGGATTNTYLLTNADVGSTIRCQVTGTNGDGSAVSFTAVTPVIGGVSGGAGAPVSTAAPVISGSPIVGGTLTATAGTWTGTTPMTFSYQWRRCDANGSNCTDISGATASTYVPILDDVGRTLRVVVTASN